MPATSCNTTATRAALRLACLEHGLDMAQVLAVYHRTRARVHQEAAARPRRISAQTWAAWIDSTAERALLTPHIDDAGVVAALDLLEQARPAVPDPLQFKVLKDLPERMDAARRAERRQLRATAGLRGHDVDVVHERYMDLRTQWREDLVHLPADQRPVPPAAWLLGVAAVDTMASSLPPDPATMYALYRLQTDPSALPPPTRSYAVIDLETASPEGPQAFKPEHGCIIEVAVWQLDPETRPTGHFEQLVQPCPDADPARGGYGTGAVDVHGITWNDVQHAPTWQQVQHPLAQVLAGRIAVAHNWPFEQRWLAHHLAPGTDYEAWPSAVDTLAVMRQHRPHLPDRTLATTCAHLGVPYGKGHRADHDTRACAQVLTALRAALAQDWARSPARAHAPLPAPGVGRRIAERTARCWRLRVGDPGLRQDAWSVADRSLAA